MIRILKMKEKRVSITNQSLTKETRFLRGSQVSNKRRGFLVGEEKRYGGDIK